MGLCGRYLSQIFGLPLSVFLVVLLAPAVGMSATQENELLSLYNGSSSRKPFVAFLARDDTLTGHAFVAVGVELDNGLLFYEGLFGFYPAGGGKKGILKALFKADGIIDYQFADMSASFEFRIPISTAQRDEAISVLEKWKSEEPKYNLFAFGGNNCSVLVKEVAQAIGLKIPADNPGLTFPEAYVRKLSERN